jgi:hypothetical protein
MDCYIVCFCTGEYEDRSESVVKVFSTKEKAEECANLLRAKLDSIGYHTMGNLNSAFEQDESAYHRPTVDGFSIDYTGAWVNVNGPYPLG